MTSDKNGISLKWVLQLHYWLSEVNQHPANRTYTYNYNRNVTMEWRKLDFNIP